MHGRIQRWLDERDVAVSITSIWVNLTSLNEPLTALGRRWHRPLKYWFSAAVVFRYPRQSRAATAAPSRASR